MHRITILGTGAKWLSALEDRKVQPSKWHQRVCNVNYFVSKQSKKLISGNASKIADIAFGFTNPNSTLLPAKIMKTCWFPIKTSCTLSYNYVLFFADNLILSRLNYQT